MTEVNADGTAWRDRPSCDWCRKPGATHTADEHPLPQGHPDYDAFYDASDEELAAVFVDVLRNTFEPARLTRKD